MSSHYRRDYQKTVNIEEHLHYTSIVAVGSILKSNIDIDTNEKTELEKRHV